MANRRASGKDDAQKELPEYHFEVSTGLKRVLGRELITKDEVAVFELVKNCYDAGADRVHIFFGNDKIVVADNGHGMSYDDLRNKWLFVAYSAKRDENADQDYRDLVAERGHYAGSKGIGRFSSDRLGDTLILRTKTAKSSSIHRLEIKWNDFEGNDKQHFDTVPVRYSKVKSFSLPQALQRFQSQLKHGTSIELRGLRQKWDHKALLSLKSSLSKLINPFGSDVDSFKIIVDAPEEKAGDKRVTSEAAKTKEKPLNRELVNGRVGNFIFSDLQKKTTFIEVAIDSEHLNTTLMDRGEVVYEIREPNPYPRLANSDFKFEIYYLNQSAKLTFARRVGLPSVRFGSVFLFRNGFRVYPIGEETDDWFGFDRRKQQGYNRFLGTREIIGRVDVFGSDVDFQEASSRNQGLIETEAVRQLRKAVRDHGLKRLEKYVVPVSWKDPADAESDNLSRLLTDPGRARVSAAVARLVGREGIELVGYSKKLIDLVNERSSEFESSLESLRLIAEKTGDKALIGRLARAKKRFEKLKKSEAIAHKVADRERASAVAAKKRADHAEASAEHERRRAYFLESTVDLDAATILNLHHQVTIYAVDLSQQIENLLADTQGQRQVSRELLLKALEQMAFLNRKVLTVSKFATRARFTLDSEKIETDLAAFVTEYIDSVANVSGGSRLRVEVVNRHSGFPLRFKPIDASILVDNLISNARKAKSTRITFELEPLGKAGLVIRISDNGKGLARGVDRSRIFEMGYTSTRGSGLGLYHVRQILGEIGGSIELQESSVKGSMFVITFAVEK